MEPEFVIIKLFESNIDTLERARLGYIQGLNLTSLFFGQ